MITLKVNPYSKEELCALANLLGMMEEIMNKKCRPGETCKSCEYRHVCYDITSAKEHTIKLLNEKK